MVTECERDEDHDGGHDQGRERGGGADRHRPSRNRPRRTNRLRRTNRPRPADPARATGRPASRWRGRRHLAGALAAAAALCALVPGTLLPALPTLASAATGGDHSPAQSLRSALSRELPGPFAGPYSEPLSRPYAKPMSAPVARTDLEQARISAYWSAQRRSRAQVADAAGRDGRPVPKRLDGPTGTDQTLEATSPPPPSTGSPYRYGGLVAKTVGRLFTTINGIDYACSATVVTSTGRDLAVTAGHCLHEGSGGAFATNVAFMPGYSDGSLPFGLWAARLITVTPGWGLRGDFDYDTGFILFNTRAGQHIENVVGGEKIAFNQPRTLAQYAFGYPRLGKYTGEELIYCAGPSSDDPYGTTSMGLACDMTGGASGGPLFTGLGRAGPGAGWVDSVVSYAYASDPETVYGTYFGRAIELLYYQSNDL
ncbi:serine protease [Parafrankia sp. EUN1f]|uniref:trypsin-like serine peptidase n=1 Tax=Parafrankia sp. EUN1f TaxID=102897 RepID=UPI0001C442C3|nr:hypothetical protein [Parafrankia sp. EUN1f]EFC84852.1 hypothetical protein FrEUN1fDRAFT_2034 [Parafrankia sp. EUN1f]